MKKVFLFLMATSALVLSSCGDDDGGGPKRPSAITLVGDGVNIVYGFTYDNKGRLSTLNSNYDGAHSYTFIYNDAGKIINAAASGSVTDSYSFTYGSDGKLATVTPQGDATIPVTWTTDTTMNFDGTTVTYDEKGDLQLFETASFTRDSGKGAFASVKGADPFILTLIEQFTLFYASKRPVATISGAGIGYVMSNTFEGGYLSQSTFSSSGNTVTMNVTY